MGVAKQIIGSFEDLGKEIVRETVKAPVDIAGAILEGGSRTKSSGKTSQQKQSSAALNPDKNSSLGKFEKSDDVAVKRQIARAALEQLSQKPKQELTDWEKKKKDEETKKNAEKERLEAENKQLKSGTQKQRRGNLYGVKQKQSPTEKMVNVKTD